MNRAIELDEQLRQRQLAELSEKLAVIEARGRRNPARGTATGGESPGGTAAEGESAPRAAVGRPGSVGTAVGGESAFGIAVGSESAVGTVVGGPGAVGAGGGADLSTTSAGGYHQLGVIGSSGSSGSDRHRMAEPGGHPEDDRGDPEAVAKAICLRLLTGAARPRAGLATALRRRGIPDDVANRVLDRFVEVGLIDDVAYAEAFVAAKHRERALGAAALRTELRRKGVADQTVDAAISVLDQDAERRRAQALISRRVDAAMSNGPVAARRRLVALLARRGYSAELACQVVDAALDEYGEEQDDGWYD